MDYWDQYAKRCAGCVVCQEFIAEARKPTTGAYVDHRAHFLHIDSKECQREGWQQLLASRRKTGNGAHSGAFAFTLTMSPKDPFTVGDMLAAVRKVMRQKSCTVKRYAWYYEEKGRDENGDPLHPHIHGMYETESGGRIEAKHWKRAWSIWDERKPMGKGFRGGYHRPVRSDEQYGDYIKKDGGMSESWTMDEQPE